MAKTLIHTSEQLYSFLLQLYPKQFRQEFGQEMQYVFSESLSEVYEASREPGIALYWVHTLSDVGKSLIKQHVENSYRKDSMKAKNNDLIQDNKVFLWVAAATVFILMIPFVAMQFSGEVDWDETDFIVIGTLLFGMGSLFVLAARKIQKTSHRIIVGLGFLFMVLWLWVELAVGLFTNWGS